MAAAPFTCTCPHCESRVTLKDPALIGKKIRCPKCKEPFRVEAPGEALATPVRKKSAAAAAPATSRKTRPLAEDEEKRPVKKKPIAEREEEDYDEEDESPAKKKKKKKKKANQLPLILAGGGVAALLVIVVVVFVIMNQNTNKSPNASANQGKSPTNPGGTGATPTNPQASIPQGWEEYSNPEAGFSVLFPGKPEVKIQESSGIGKSTTVMFIDESKNISFFVVTHQVPIINGKPQTFDEWLQQSSYRNEKLNKRVSEEREIKNGSMMGKEYITLSPNFSAKVRMIMANNRVYTLNVGGTEAYVKSAQAQQLLDSFKLTSQ